MGMAARLVRLHNMIQVVTSALPPLGVRLANAAARLAEGCHRYRSVAAQLGSPLNDLSGALEGYEGTLAATLRGQAENLAALGAALVAAGCAYAEADDRAIVPVTSFCPVPAPPGVPLATGLDGSGLYEPPGLR